MLLVDTHSHIHEDGTQADVDATVARARQAGVELIVTLGVNRADSERALALAERHATVVAAAGVHPHDAKDASAADLDALDALARDARVALVGEIGLDYYRDLSPRDVQRRVFRRQLETAARAGKPVAVHAREAHDDVLAMLEEWSRELGGRLPDGRPPGVLHYFSGDAELARRYVDLGFVISIHTSVTHPKAHTLREVARELPLDRLVLETDSPYGAPQRVRGKRNEPAYVADAAAQVAEVRGVPVDEVAIATSRTAMRLLGVAVPAAGGR
jgi:TatD DNase family protein